MSNKVRASFFKVFKTLKNMNEEDKTILFKQKLQGKKTASQWLLDIKSLVDLDTIIDHNRKRFILWPIMCFVLSFLPLYIYTLYNQIEIGSTDFPDYLPLISFIIAILP